MKKLVYSALALTLVSVPGIASDNDEWSSLDQELNNLSSSLSAPTTGPKIGGWVISSFRYDKRQAQPNGTVPTYPTASGFDTITPHYQSGFQLDTVRIEISGDAGNDYGYKVSFELANSSSAVPVAVNTFGLLKDAYGTFKIGDSVTGKVGNFKIPFLRSALLADNRLLFLERTGLGRIFGTRELGIGFNGAFDTVSWWAAFQNGGDAQGYRGLFTGRFAANLMGNGVGQNEGAYGGGDDTNLTIAGAVAYDNSVPDGLLISGSVDITHGPFSLSGEVVSFDKGTNSGATSSFPTGTTGTTLDPIIGVSSAADTVPWDITGTFMFTDQYEVGARYQDANDPLNTTSWGFVVNRYVQGHDIKWQAEYNHIKTDSAFKDRDQFGIGLAVSF
jgi:hypothetical protein